MGITSDRQGNTEQARDKVRVLIFAEAVTLAHVARPVALAGALDSAAFDVHLAHCPRYAALLGELPFTQHSLQSITPEQFLLALSDGKPLYDRDTLAGYVKEDLALIEQVQPDIVVGDFRLSLSVSAELARVPYVAISNAYWSPYCRQHYTVPDLPISRALGPALAQPLFTLARRFVFALHCLPLNGLRRSFGLKGLGYDLARVYTHADHTLYADVPDWFNMRELPPEHHFIGPVLWSPDCALPDWWSGVPGDKPVVYVTLGSSGNYSLLPHLLQALGQLEVTALVSTAGADLPGALPDNVYAAKYLPGDEAVQLADLVICNGGSPTVHQALRQGVPVLGLAGNLDQFLNMTAVCAQGAGRLLRADSANAGQLVSEVSSLLADQACQAAAQRLSAQFDQYEFKSNFCRTINEIAVG